jgi:hypothetical protein
MSPDGTLTFVVYSGLCSPLLLYPWSICCIEESIEVNKNKITAVELQMGMSNSYQQ